MGGATNRWRPAAKCRGPGVYDQGLLWDVVPGAHAMPRSFETNSASRGGTLVRAPGIVRSSRGLIGINYIIRFYYDFLTISLGSH